MQSGSSEKMSSPAFMPVRAARIKQKIFGQPEDSRGSPAFSPFL
jgi:hypothetical protein